MLLTTPFINLLMTLLKTILKAILQTLLQKAINNFFEGAILNATKVDIAGAIEYANKYAFTDVNEYMFIE